MKKFILFLFLFVFGTSVFASENIMHSVVLENNNDGYNVILQTDTLPKVTRSIKASDKLVINVKQVTASDNLNALYKTNIDSLLIERINEHEINIYIKADNISKATILSQTSDGNLTILNEAFPWGKLIWLMVGLAIFIQVIKSAKSFAAYESSISIKKDIKDREIEMYRNFQKELSSMPDRVTPSINSPITSAYATNVLHSKRHYKELVKM